MMADSNHAGAYVPYPEYVDSGIEWENSKPLSWETHTLKYIVTCNDEVLSEKTDPDFEFEYIDISSVSRNEGITSTEGMKFSDSPSRARRLVREGDIIVSTVRTYLEAIAPISSIDDGKIASTGFAVLRPKNLISEFAQYALRARHFIDSVVSRSTGVSYPAINASELMNIKILSPSLAEQRTIAAFLDHETARIDRLIEKQQRLIELLKEKRQAVISHAVTKGLNPDAPMKDSGVEWLGQVPEHWVVKRLKHISPKIGVGLVINPSTYTRDEGTFFIFGGDVKEYGFDLTKTRRISQKDSDLLKPSRLRHRDLVSVRVGYPGITAVVSEELEGSNCASVIIIRRGDFDSDWLCAAMNIWVGRQQVDLASYGAAQKQYNVSDAIEFIFPVPPKTEQEDIARYVEASLAKFNKLTQQAQIQIELLQERRTALISAAVTGKIDVRGWVKPEESSTSDAA